MKLGTKLFILGLVLLSWTKLYSQDSSQTSFTDSLSWVNEEVHAFHKTKLQLLGLDSVKSSSDSLCIRIFVNPSFRQPDQLIELRLVDHKWKGTSIRYYLRYNQQDQQFYVEDIKRRKVKPRQSWNVFIKELITRGILTLPDEELIASYPVIVDGTSYCVQITTAHTYRFYCYSNPAIARNKIQEADTFFSIIETVWAELGLDKD